MKISAPLLTAFLVSSTLSVSSAAVTYVDAGPSNLALWDGSAFSPTTGGSGGAADNNWHLRTGFANGGILTSNETGTEDAPMLVLTLTGLTPGTSYSITGYFWSPVTQSWRFKGTLSASLSASDNALPWPNNGVDGNNDNILDNGTPVVLSDDLIDNHPEVSWSRAGSGTSAPGTNLSGLDTVGGDGLSDSYFDTGILVTEGDRRLYEASVGQIAANGAGEIEIYIDDLRGQTSGTNRTWFDGVGFEAIPEPSAGILSLLACGLIGLRRRRV